MMKKLIRVCAMVLALALLAGSALAENVNVRQFYSNEGDYLFYLRTLSDGRMLFGGSKQADAGKDISRKWLLCLNEDRTVSWEYITPEAEAGTICSATERPDGTIAVVYDMGDEDHEAPEGKNTLIRFYTPDGQATGREMAFADPAGVDEETSHIVMYHTPAEGGQEQVMVMDWDGSRVFELDTSGLGDEVLHFEWIIGGVMLYGANAAQDGRARVKRVKGKNIEGETVWDLTLDHLWEDSDTARADDLVMTVDGGCAVLVNEAKTNDSGAVVWRSAVVKIDEEGRVQWTCKDETEKEDNNCRLYFASGKIVMYIPPDIKDDWDPDAPRIFRWFERSGEDLGTTELVLKPEDFPILQRFLVPEDGSEPAKAMIDYVSVYGEDTGLLVSADVCAYRPGEDGIQETIEGSDDTVVLTVPEPWRNK